MAHDANAAPAARTPGASPARDRFDALNSTVRYTSWAVLGRTGASIDAPPDAARELEDWEADLHQQDIVVRGLYDVSGLRAGTDLMVWLHGPTAEGLQAALRGFRHTAAGAATSLAWAAMGTHRRAEFTREHVPSFMLDTQPLDWLCVYPFVRSYEWYLLPEADRREMLREHGLAGRGFPGVQANTVASFALGDWEWILALESNDLHDLVDLMRDLRGTSARRHVREEVPFHSGRRVEPADAVDVLR